MRLWPLLLILLCWSVSVAAQPSPKLHAPGIDSADDRVPVDTSKMPWRAIGKLQTNLAASCTGTLVGPRLVLTAGHCVYQPNTQQLLPLDSLHFLLGYDRAAYVAHARVIRAEHLPALAANTRAKDRDPTHDWLLLVLDQPLGEKFGMLKLADRPLEAHTLLQSAGYAQDKSQIMTADPDCQVLVAPTQAQPVIVHDCEITHGNSGGPLLVRQDGEWRIAGVNVQIAQVAQVADSRAPDKKRWVGLAFDVALVRALIDRLNAAPVTAGK